MSRKKHKIIVVGLPKTGTSTLAIMLRILGYDVTGPDGDCKPDNDILLREKFSNHDAFQDYPWCFEWKRFIDEPNMKFIVLQRDREDWFKSFHKSYGRKEDNYMSYPYMKIKKGLNHKSQFLNYFNSYYDGFHAYYKKDHSCVLTISIDTFQWQDLCSFLNEPIPKTMFGKAIAKPHINKQYYVSKYSKQKQMKVKLRALLIPLIGRKKWNAFVAFLRKNKIYN